MPLPSRFDNNLFVSGRLMPTTLDIPADSIDNISITASAKIATTKLRHRHALKYSQSNIVVVAETKPLSVMRANGTITEIVAGLLSACQGAATVIVDVKNNNVSILSTPLVLVSSHISRAPVVASLFATTLDTNDWLDVVITVAASTGILGTGIFVTVQTEVDDLAVALTSFDFSDTKNSQYLPLM